MTLNELGSVFVSIRVHRTNAPTTIERRPAYIDKKRRTIIGRVVPSDESAELVVPYPAYPGERLLYVLGEGWHSYPEKRAK